MSRAATRVAGTTGALLLTAVLTAAPAFADNPIGPAEGEEREPNALGTVETILLYVGIPLLVATVVAAITWLPGAVKQGRYRPAQGWTAAPVWFAGPVSAVEAVNSAETGDVVRGGASGSW